MTEWRILACVCFQIPLETLHASVDQRVRVCALGFIVPFPFCPRCISCHVTPNEKAEFLILIAGAKLGQWAGPLQTSVPGQPMREREEGAWSLWASQNQNNERLLLLIAVRSLSSLPIKLYFPASLWVSLSINQLDNSTAVPFIKLKLTPLSHPHINTCLHTHEHKHTHPGAHCTAFNIIYSMEFIYM